VKKFLFDTPVILVAEDREDEILLLRRAFKHANILNPLQIVRDGEEAVAYLKGEGRFSNRAEYPLPSLMLLDLKMPRKDGFEVLQWIRQQPTLSSLRVVVLTASDEIRDVNMAYQLGANSFLVKPVDFDNFVDVIETLQGYWLWMSQAPEVSRPPRENRRTETNDGDKS
jgi:CheY-like chemotaxis protein